MMNQSPSNSEFTTPTQKFLAYAHRRRDRRLTSSNLAQLPVWPGYTDAFVNQSAFRWTHGLPSPSRMSFLPCGSPPPSRSPSPPPPPPPSPDFRHSDLINGMTALNMNTDTDADAETDMPASASASADRGRFLTLPDVHMGESNHGRDSTADEMHTLVCRGSEIDPAERERRWNLITERVKLYTRYEYFSDGQGLWCERDRLPQQAWRIARYTERLMARFDSESENESESEDDGENDGENENENGNGNGNGNGNESGGECKNPIITDAEINRDSDRLLEICSRSMTDVSNDSDSDDEFMNAVQYI